MMRLLLLTFVALASATPTFAEPLRIISGDHAAFSRIVLPLPEDVEWTIERDEQTLTVAYSGHSDGFDESLVFQKIQKTRVVATSSTPSTLTVSFICDCGVSAFATGNGYLAIDIADPGFAITNPVPIESTQNRQAEARTANDQGKGATFGFSLPWIGTSQPHLDSAFATDNGQRRSISEMARVQADRDDNRNLAISILERARTQLTSEISIAASSGLLIPDDNPSFDRTDVSGNTDEPDPVFDNGSEERSATQSGNIRFSTSLDVTNAQVDREDLSSASGFVCPSDEDFAIENWAGSTGFNGAIGELRAQLYVEFDKLDHAVAEKLARAYVHYGFGAEAIAILKLDPRLFAANEPISVIAEIMENGSLQKSSTVDSHIDCDSDVALWALLSRIEHDSPTRFNESAALRAANKLPKHLRLFIAPLLSDRFLMNHDSVNAAKAMRSIDRLPEALRPEGQLAQANLSLENGEIEEGEDYLLQVVASGSMQSPEALVRLVESRLKQQEPISFETAALVRAYAQEYRGSELGDRLQNAQILALAKSGQFDHAFSLLKELHDGGHQDLKAIVLAELTSTANAITFLDHVLRQPLEGLADLEKDIQNHVVRRLNSLGFPSQAQRILTASIGSGSQVNDLVLVAEVALALHQPLQAEAALSGLEGAEAITLRARAFEMSGLHDEAHELYQRQGAESDAVVSAWLSDRWDHLIPEEDSRYGPISAIARRELEPIPNADGMLAHAKLALEESADLRGVISSLLADSAGSLTVSE